MWSFLTGFGVAIGLIVAIGAQNAWVLSKSLRGEHPAVIAVVCFSIDAVLITLGVFGLSTVQAWIPGLVPLLTWLGVGLLCWLAAQSYWRAWQGNGGLQAAEEGGRGSAWRMAGQAMVISLVNPHVYLDTVVLIGSVGAQQAVPAYYALGASLASVVWFSSLAGLGRHLGGWLRSPLHWRVFDAGIGSVMLLVAVSLVA
ncbi:LysE/ArgO family amino acid transporter [Saccharospirillum salsuginis]|uniref:Transporter n=1 Tax=Saccharospirillum salsuginis TaxID=418750 RepID=A0A918K162_9GAMM|nr:LysE family transporter [Saccharospirillum salsuginis]GGX41137.1 transporter [Saccharospirillum salsuginis]